MLDWTHIINSKDVFDFICFESQGHRLADSREDGDVVKFLNDAVDGEGVGGVAGCCVDDLEPAARLDVFFFHPFVEG